MHPWGLLRLWHNVVCLVVCWFHTEKVHIKVLYTVILTQTTVYCIHINRTFQSFKQSAHCEYSLCRKCINIILSFFFVCGLCDFVRMSDWESLLMVEILTEILKVKLLSIPFKQTENTGQVQLTFLVKSHFFAYSISLPMYNIHIGIIPLLNDRFMGHKSNIL